MCCEGPNDFPFSLVCICCDAGMGIESFEQALAAVVRLRSDRLAGFPPSPVRLTDVEKLEQFPATPWPRATPLNPAGVAGHRNHGHASYQFFSAKKTVKIERVDFRGTERKKRARSQDDSPPARF